MQQTATINTGSASQLISGISVPQPADSKLIYDALFSALFRSDTDGEGPGSGVGSAKKYVQGLFLLHRVVAEPAAMLSAAVAAIGSKFERPAPLGTHGTW